MEPLEALSIVFSRIRELESENVAKKILGILLIEDNGQEMIRLAFGPDSSIQNLVERAKVQLGQVLKPNLSPPISPTTILSPISPNMLRPPNPFWNSQVNASTLRQMPNPIFSPPNGYVDTLPEGFRLRRPPLEFQERVKLVNPRIRSSPNDFYYHHLEATGPPRSQRSQTLSELPHKPCQYFIKGSCKNGRNCRYLHGGPESLSQMFGQVGIDDDEDISPQALENLELEIAELLKSRRGRPIPIAFLPILYYETFGRTLEAEGYLTERQRHGKAGYSLTKLLAQLKSGVVQMIERPHGQYAVVLAEDASKYMGYYHSSRNDPGPIVCGSRQIYLTFPADSTFSEEDVSDYFNTYGPVEDVRIPCQQRRMFGFVTFASSDTVELILSKGNPHYVCGARVLVKPYREKPKLLDRKVEPPRFHNSRHAHMDDELHSEWETSRFLRKPYAEEGQEALEVLGMRLSNLQLAHKSLADGSYFGYSLEELNVSQDEPNHHPSTECFNYLLDVLNNSSARDDTNNPTATDKDQERTTEVPATSVVAGNTNNPTAADKDQESRGLDLPDSPFESQK